MSVRGDGGEKKEASSKGDRAQKLAAQLRANLRRRKTQQRVRDVAQEAEIVGEVKRKKDEPP